MDFRWALGIDWGDDHLALVCLRQAFFRVELVDYSLSVSLPGASQTERDRAIEKALTEFLNKKKRHLDNVTICLPRRKAAFTYVDLPQVAAENLEQVLEFEFERLFPFKKESCYFGHRICSFPAERDQIRVQVVAVQRDFLQRILSIVQGARLELMAVEPSSFAIGRYLGFASKDQIGDCLVLTVVAGQLNLDLWRGEDLTFSRSLTLRSSDGEITRQVQKEVLATRERFKVQETFYCGVLPSETVSAIPSLSVLGERGLIANRAPSEAVPYLLPACGAALRGLGRGLTDLNLLPKALRSESARLFTMTTSVFLVLLFLFGLAWGGSLISRKVVYAKKLSERIKALDPQIESLQKIGLEIEALNRDIDALHSSERQSPKKLLLLKELTQIIPKAAYLTELRADDEKIELVGLAKSASELIPIIESSPVFQSAQFSSPITKRGGDQERFALKAEIERNEEVRVKAQKASSQKTVTTTTLGITR